MLSKVKEMMRQELKLTEDLLTELITEKKVSKLLGTKCYSICDPSKSNNTLQAPDGNESYHPL